MCRYRKTISFPGGNRNAAAHHALTDYIAIKAEPIVFYSLHKQKSVQVYFVIEADVSFGLLPLV